MDHHLRSEFIHLLPAKFRSLGTIILFIILMLVSIWLPEGSKKTLPEPVTQTAPIKIATSEALVTKVIDGDTIQIATGQKVRYIGMDTPETHHPGLPVQCFGEEASARNAQLVLGMNVRLVKDVSETDRYGRLLRYVYVGDVFVNKALVDEGYAHAATFPPDVKFQEIFTQAEQTAREKNMGLWNACPTN